MNSLNFCFSVRSLYFSFTFEGWFHCIYISSFNILNISLQFHLVCMVYDEKSTIMIFLFLLYVRCFVSLTSFKVFSLSLVFCSLNVICLNAVFFFPFHLFCLDFIYKKQIRHDVLANRNWYEETLSVRFHVTLSRSQGLFNIFCSFKWQSSNIFVSVSPTIVLF